MTNSTQGLRFDARLMRIVALILAFYFCFLSVLFLLVALAGREDTYRVRVDPHTQALVKKTWSEKRRHYTVQFASVEFITKRYGESVLCQTDMETDGSSFEGDYIEIVPRPNSCFNPILATSNGSGADTLVFWIGGTLGAIGIALIVYGSLPTGKRQETSVAHNDNVQRARSMRAEE